MRVMIFGDVASGKSTFAKSLGSILAIPVFHLDAIMKQIGRDDRNAIRSRIEQIANQPDWIIDGNAFTKDFEYRITQADVVIVFEFGRFRTLANYVVRGIKGKKRDEKRIGGGDEGFKVSYFLPYIIYKFPARRKAAVQRAEEQNKKIYRIYSHKQAAEFLQTVAVDKKMLYNAKM